MDASLLSELVVQIFRANGALTAWGDRFAAESGLTTARWQVLGAISMAKEPSTSPQIAERMGITRQGVQKQLNPCGMRGWLCPSKIPRINVPRGIP